MQVWLHVGFIWGPFQHKKINENKLKISSILTAFWLHFSSILGPLLAPFWLHFDALEWCPFYCSFIWILRVPLGTPKGSKNRSKNHLKSHQILVGFLDPFGSHFGCLWAPIWASKMHQNFNEGTFVFMHRVDEVEPPGPSRNLSEMAPKLHRFSEPKSVGKWLPKASQKEAQNHLKNS